MRSRFIPLLLLPVLLPVLLFRAPAAGQESHLLVVVGLGGGQEYRAQFHDWAVDLARAAVDRFGLSEDQVVYLGERPAADPVFIDGRSTVENIASVITGMATEAGPQDRVLIVLIGHGTGQGEEVEFNLPGPDLTPWELDEMLEDFSTQTIGVVNTSPSSGPFIPVLSGPNRVVLTATRTAQERNETQFGRFFVEAMTGEGTDLDRDGRVSLAEAFQHTRAEVDRYYTSQNLLATEHALLDDNGDGEGSGELGEDVPDGMLASGFWLGSAGMARAGSTVPDSITDPVLRALYQERADLERRVVQLRALRGQMEESRYEEELETLLVELALKNREIREKGGGG